MTAFQSLEMVLEDCEILRLNKRDILDYKIINAVPCDAHYQKLDAQDKYYKETEIVIELTAYDENGERKSYVDRLLEWQDIVFFDFYDEENKYQVTYLDEKEGVLVIKVIKS